MSTPPGAAPRDPGLIEAIVGDGRPLLQLTVFALLFSAGFALFLSIRREFLPHDIAFLGMTPAELCAFRECRLVAFMFHDRVSRLRLPRLLARRRLRVPGAALRGRCCPVPAPRP